MKRIFSLLLLVIFPLLLATSIYAAGFDSISGTVKDVCTGNPIEGIWVYAEEYDTGDYSGSGSTDSNGNYTIKDLAAGDYRVCASGPGYITKYYNNRLNWEDADRVTVIQNQTTEDINFDLVKAISSAEDQTFYVGQETTAISPITIKDSLSPTITAVNDIRIHIPSGLDMLWDTSDISATISGIVSGKVSTTVGYEDQGKTLFIDVIKDFAAGDPLTVPDRSFTCFLLPAGTNHQHPPVVSFLDKEDPSREVAGAAADGVSKVIIQISGLGDGVTVGDIEITIPDTDGHLENDKKIEDGVFTQTWTAPEDFVREGHSEDLTQGKREIHFTITVNGEELEHPKFFLVKPPVVLLHGLWSNASAWDNLKSRLQADHGYQYVVAYQYPNSVSFDQLKSVIYNAIYLALGLAKIDNYVAKKADVVAHSMGGVITKLYGHESNIKSITTVGTPHFGSPLADILWSLVDDDQNPFERFMARCFERSGHPATNGAIEDLRTTLHVEANRISVPNYVISGISPLTNQTNILFVNLIAHVFKFSGLLSWSATLLDLNQLIFKGERNDWVVSEPSQEGGCVGDDDYVWWHCAETTDEEILQKIVNFLHRTSFSAFMTQTTSIKSQEKPRLQYALPAFEMGVSSGWVEITHPIEGQVFQPGDTVDVEVNTSDEDAMVIITTSTGESALIDHAPYNFQFVIPNEVIGPLNIVVGARDDKGFIGLDEVTISVASSSNLIDIKVYPEINPLYLSVGATVPLTVYGLYDDGVTREITSSGSGSSYISSNPDIVEVSSEGLITVKSQGEAIVTIENSGVKKEITVIGIEPCEGDFDRDGDVDGSDLATFADAYAVGDPQADLNGDEKVDTEDLAIFAADFGRTDCP